jgi:hypothetical protein
MSMPPIFSVKKEGMQCTKSFDRKTVTRVAEHTFPKSVFKSKNLNIFRVSLSSLGQKM